MPAPPIPASAILGSDLGALLATEQHTLTAPLQQSGIGLHTGATTQVQILPAAPGQGRYFVRVDLPDAPTIPAGIESVHPTLLSTELGSDSAQVRTVEHLLAALAGMGVDNARIEIDGPEVPLLDGSAQGWVTEIARVGVVSQGVPRRSRSLQKPLWVYQGDTFVAALPAPELRFTYGIDFESAAIGNQWQSWSPTEESFASAIAPARTFGLAHQVEYLRAQGLIQGGSLENALVCDAETWLNPPLRFANEPARHKLLDLVGDLSLLGYFPVAHFLAYKASHKLHNQLAALVVQALAAEQ